MGEGLVFLPPVAYQGPEERLAALERLASDLDSLLDSIRSEEAGLWLGTELASGEWGNLLAAADDAGLRHARAVAEQYGKNIDGYR